MKNVKVLYVEDEASIRAFVKILFKKNGIDNIVFAFNGLEALELYHKDEFDIVVTDMVMPVMDGFELIHRIREIDPQQTFAMVTGLDNIDDLRRAIELRVNFFVSKPIKPARFNALLQDALRSIKQKKELAFSNTILKQYKNALDGITLVSKTDKDGIITYVNENLCKLFKYSKDELIGKNYSIFRHPSETSRDFDHISSVINDKQQWKGTVKNKAKDGTTYITDVLITPLLDANGEIIEFISTRYDITELELFKADLQKQLSIAMQDVVDTQKEVVFTMGAIGETRSKETGMHVKRVAQYSYTLALLAGLNKDDAELLRMASPLHDIGKVAIPDHILNKPGRLTPDEFVIMKTHASLGYDMLKVSSKEILKASAIVAYEHHERWDGQGYPRGLKKDETHIYGRITAICDVFDALGSDRVYKKAWRLEKIIKLLVDGKGTQFDPKLIDLFLNNIDKFLLIRDELKDKSSDE